ncbi:MAG: CBS domain-containing protein [Rubricoccaceae bacterium]
MPVSVATLLAHKGGRIVAASPDETVYAAIARMVEHNVGAIVVLEGDALAGIFTERDYLRRIALEGRTSRETVLRDVMTTRLVTIGPQETVERCLALMTDHRIRHLPVLEAGRLVGVISIGDCVRALADAARADAESLHRFVSGGYPG